MFTVKKILTANNTHCNMKELFAKVKQVRPGRNLFVREWLLGVDQAQQESCTPHLQLVIVHGSCASEAQFHPLLNELESILLNGNKHRVIKCIMYDMLSCGKSPVVYEWEAYQGLELQRDLNEIVEQHTDPSIPVFFVSHSYGPSMIIHWMLNNPEMMSSITISGLIWLGAAVRVAPSLPFPDGGHPVFLLPVWILQCIQPTLTKEFLQKAIDDSNKALKEQCLAENDNNDMFMVKAFYRQTKWATFQELAEAVQSIPLIHFHGVSDEIVKVEWGQKLVNHLNDANSLQKDDPLVETTQNGAPGHPIAKFVPVENASHLLMIEQPSTIAKDMMDFLTRHAF